MPAPAWLRDANRRRLRRRRARGNVARVADGLRRAFAAAGLERPRLRVVASDAVDGARDVWIRREGRRHVLLVSAAPDMRIPATVGGHAAAALYWFMQSDPVTRMIRLNASDGDAPSRARFAYCSNRADVIALPDPYFWRSRGYRAIARVAEAAPAWSARRAEIVWRGRPNGAGHFTLDPAQACNPAVIQRLRMAMACRSLGIDFRFTPRPEAGQDGALADAGLLAEPIPVAQWAEMKFAIDIDGWTNAWSNLLTRLALGCCVLKVASPVGYRQWFYDRLVPWEHYVPVRADLADLAERVDWLAGNTAAAGEIAANGRRLARSLTFAGETRSAARLIAGAAACRDDRHLAS